MKSTESMETLAQRVEPLVRAGYSGLWIESNEVDEVERELLVLGSEKQWVVGVWDFCRGLRFPHNNGLSEKYTPVQVVAEVEVGASGGMLAVAVKRNMQVQDVANLQTGTPGKRLVIVLEHFYRFLENAAVVQGLYNVLLRAKAERITFVVVGPSNVVPVELDTLFLRLEWDPPAEPILESIALGLLNTEKGEKVPVGAARAALGLTRREAENAFALGLAKRGKIEVEEVWKVKGHQINSTGFLQFNQGGPGFESLGGLSGLKQFGKRLLRPGNEIPTKGLLLLGPAGTGKSAFAKALGAECGRPTLSLDMGALYNKHVGETEGRLRQALKVADTMGEVVLFVDEIDKALAGADSDGDSGVSARVFGTLLTWLNDREERGSKVFFVGTCNDPGRLTAPSGGAFVRAERFDGMFFLDLPTKQDREAIWLMYGRKFLGWHKEIDSKRPNLPESLGWTGAEIKACCRLAAVLDVPLLEAAKHIVPVSVTAGEQIQALRGWATGRCCSAETGGIYHLQERNAVAEQAKQGKRVVEGPLHE